jgi:norsolorinic acid ketoreductase
MASTIVLITGANRGLGLGLLQRYLAQPNHTVIAGNRDPGHPSSQALSKLPKGEGSKLIVVKIDASIREDAFSAVKQLQNNHGINHIDIVIANAGVSYAWPTVAELKLDDLHGHLGPNVYGFITLYQATRTLLQNSSKEPIFTPIGSTAGCITFVSPLLLFLHKLIASTATNPRYPTRPMAPPRQWSTGLLYASTAKSLG